VIKTDELEKSERSVYHGQKRLEWCFPSAGTLVSFTLGFLASCRVISHFCELVNNGFGTKEKSI